MKICDECHVRRMCGTQVLAHGPALCEGEPTTFQRKYTDVFVRALESAPMGLSYHQLLPIIGGTQHYLRQCTTEAEMFGLVRLYRRGGYGARYVHVKHQPRYDWVTAKIDELRRLRTNRRHRSNYHSNKETS